MRPLHSLMPLWQIVMRSVIDKADFVFAEYIFQE